MRPALVGGIVAVVVLLAFLLGTLYAGGFKRDADPDPPCEDGEAVTPDGDGCVPETHACNAYGYAVERQTVSCVARSEDGRGVLRPSLAGTGRVDVKVFDGAGRVVHQRAYALANGSPGDVALQGEPGAWRLEVTFSDVAGDARIVLWG